MCRERRTGDVEEVSVNVAPHCYLGFRGLQELVDRFAQRCVAQVERREAADGCSPLAL